MKLVHDIIGDAVVTSIPEDLIRDDFNPAIGMSAFPTVAISVWQGIKGLDSQLVSQICPVRAVAA